MSFETLLGQENIARTLKNSIERGQLAHAYLFCGPRGVGKTTSARIFAKIINCSNPGPNLEPCGECESCRSFAENRSYCIHELDAASNNGVEDIRALNEQVRIPPQVGRYSVFIIDEVHMLSQSAFNAFLKTLEEPPAHAVFILATTEKHKVLPTILSRCQTFDFNRISIGDMVKNMSRIAKEEGVTISEDAMHIIAQKADGAMRDALTMFDQMVAFCGKEVTYDQVVKNLNVLDYDNFFALTDNFLTGDYAGALVAFDSILARGFNAMAFISGLSSHFRDLLVCKNGASRTLLELAPSVAEKYESFCGKCPTDFLFKALEITTSCEIAYKQNSNPRLLIEFALIKLCNLVGLKSDDSRPIPVSVPESKPEAKPAAVLEAEPVSVSGQEPEPQPKTFKQPDPVVERKSTGLSIKDLMKESEDEAPVQQNKREATSGVASELTAEQLNGIWAELAQSESRMPRLSSAIAQAVPSFDKATKSITFEVGNLAQKEWIDKNCRSRMEGFLQKRLSDGDIRLFVDVAKAESVQTNNLYMPSDKEAYLRENSEEFRNLKSDFNLETS